MPKQQRVMLLPAQGAALEEHHRPLPQPAALQVLIRVLACAVCRTDLHVQAGELPDVPWPIVPGHQAVGEVVAAGKAANLRPGTRVGLAWLGWTCGQCRYCRSGRENLCDAALFHGYQLDGGFADHMLADARYCLVLDADADPVLTAPLLCAGLIGYRTLRMAGEAERIGIYGFGSAAHLVTQLAVQRGQEVLAFTRPGDSKAQDFARLAGASWAGGIDEQPPASLDAALIFAPAGELVPLALRATAKGGSVVCGGIHMSDIPAFPYADLWGERQIRSVANLSRQDGEEYFALLKKYPIHPEVSRYALAAAGEAMDDLRSGRLSGTAVLDLALG